MGYKGVDRKILKLLLVVGPIIYFPYSFEEFRGTRETLLHIGSVGIFLSIVVSLLLADSNRRRELFVDLLSPSPFRNVFLLLLVSALIFFFSYLLNEHTFHGARTVGNFTLGVMLFFVFISVIKIEASLDWIRLLFIPIFLNSVLAVLQYFGLDPFFLSLDPEYHSLYPKYRVAGLMDSPNMLAPFIASVVPFFFLKAIYSGWGSRFIEYTVMMFIVLVPLFLSRNLAGWISLGAVLFAIIMLVTINRFGKRKIPMLKIIICWSVIVIAIVGAGKIYANTDQESRTVKMWSMKERLDQNSAAWKMFTESPLIGNGPGYFYRHYVEYRRGEWFKTPPPTVTSRTAHQVHNEYIQMLAEGGLAVMLPLLAAFAIFLSTLLRQLRRLLEMEEPDNRTLVAIGSASGFVVIVINGLASFPFHVAPLAWTALFWTAIFFRTAEGAMVEVSES